jgi:hypothetical protein
MKGVEHTACLTASFKESLDRITLLRVINMALYMARLKGGKDPEGENQILRPGIIMLVSETFGQRYIGNPAEEISRTRSGCTFAVWVAEQQRLMIGGVSSTAFSAVRTTCRTEQ